MEADLLGNVYTNRDFAYLQSKSLDVCIIVKDKATKKVTIKSTLHVSEIQRILEKEVGENAPAQRFVTETQRLKFPKSPGPMVDILSNKAKLQSFSIKIMSFWHFVRGRQAMGVGTFEAWETFELDMGKVTLLEDQLDRIRGELFTIKMSDVIEWKDLAGIHGIGTGNLKMVKVDWSWLEVLKLIVMWSYAVVGVSIEENVNETWSPSDNDFQEKKKFKVDKAKKKVPKISCKPEQKAAGKLKGIQRAKASLNKPSQGDFELAMALSVSEECEKEREAEKDRESEDLANAMSLSLTERNEDNLPEER